MIKKLLSTPTTQLGKAGRFVVFLIKLWSHSLKLLKVNRAGQQAAALSYHTIFGIVPLAIVVLLVFQSFPAYSNIGEKIKNFVYEQANLNAFRSETSEEGESDHTIALTDHLNALIARFFQETNRGQIGLVSIVFVIWAALALLTTIEKAFNNIWHVSRGRNFLQRVISYWAVLTLGPLLLGAGIYVSTSSETFIWLKKTILPITAPIVLSYLVALVTFFLLYYVLPNTKVKVKPAIWGAAIAALVWVAARNIFSLCITEFRLYSTVYGVMALIPMTVAWIYITWLMVLFGLQLTYTTQHLKSLDAAAKKTQEYFIANDLAVINVVREVAVAFETNQAPVPLETICSKLDIPAEFGEKVLNRLVSGRLLLRTSDPTEGFVPAKDPAKVRLSDIAEAVAGASIAQSPPDQPQALQQVAQALRNSLAQYSLKQIIDGEPSSQETSSNKPTAL
jgi:membrane protein